MSKGNVSLEQKYKYVVNIIIVYRKTFDNKRMVLQHLTGFLVFFFKYSTENGAYTIKFIMW